MEEILDVVDEQDNVIGKATRKEVDEKGLLHRVSFVYLKYNGKILIEKRSATKPKRPKHYTIIGETVESGESYEEGALRGIKEEVGLEGKNLKKIGKISIRDKEENSDEISTIFMAEGNGEIDLQKEEVECVKLLTVGEIEELINSEEKISPSLRETFQIYKEAMK